MLKVFLIIVMINFAFFTFRVIATAQESIQPLTELYNTFSRIKIDVSSIPFVEYTFQSIRGAAQDPGRATSNITDFFRGISDWFQKNIGVSLFDIIKAIGNFIVWVLELIVKLIVKLIDTFI
jgi:hypothetical protein